MSWDVLFQDVPQNIDSVGKIPENFTPHALCSRKYFEDMVVALFPNIDNNDTSWMILQEESYSIEFNSGKDDPMESVMLHVRGDEKALNAIKKICEYTGWKALDCSLGEFIDFDRNPDEGFSKWRNYRNEVIRNTPSEKSK
ncbi:hypothetical protein U27_04142 [Candidatus Vecturithrix granuli]|uniref:Integron gene cassette protein n=1 Tax=Vecturithrix granuli TaxID=1499967 RepID=A0A081BXX2_VECG1|nr:hypothetical protein U27_04142 [Candidatus Vecturithrix granuli]